MLKHKFKDNKSWENLQYEDTPLRKLLDLPEILLDENKSGKINKLILSCLAILWCKDSDHQLNNKNNFFKELSREYSILYLLEMMIRLSTILIYGRLSDFNISTNEFFFDQEFEILNVKIKDLVDKIYAKLQIDEDKMDQEEIEKRIRLPHFVFDPSELRKKLNILAF